MEIVFQHPEKVSLPENRRYPLAKGVLLLNRENQELLASHKTNASVSFELYEPETEIPIYQGDLRLPVVDFQFVDLVKADYERYEEITEDFQLFLNSLSKELGIKPEKKGLKKKKVAKPNETTQESKRRQVSREISKEPSLKRSKKKINETSPRRPTVFLVTIGAFLFLAVIGIGFLGIRQWQTTQSPPTQVSEKESLEDLLAKEKFMQAVKWYPKKRKVIENELFQRILDGKKQSVNVSLLQKFQKEYPTTQGAFDSAFLKGAYKQMIQTYIKTPDDFDKDEMRMNLVGYAYLKLEKIDKAKEIAEKVEDVALSKKIASYELYKKQLTEKEKSIEGVKPTNESELKKYNQTLDEIYELKQKIAKL
ncbi:MAG TPA: hypothetical protein H9965_00605 [Candidatus Streptococcus faecavium]|uniref:Uncharacterized protein n=1 Tax=Candidatus Streptococcus faecavium TaxID=2838763 RepID=A0A9D2FUE9_9STRE|nr:hypothetical protein [Candidatus Streptococcus faecavium]